MSEEKKVFVSSTVYKVYRGGGDLSKKWFVYFYEGKKRIRKYGSINQFHTVKAREREIRKLKKQLKMKQVRRVSNTEQAIRSFLRDNWAGWRQKTREQYTYYSNVIIDYLAGREITPDLINSFLQSQRDRLHPTTYNKYLAYLKRFLRVAGYDFLMDEYKALKAHPKPARYFQRHQIKKIMKEIDKTQPDLALFVRFQYFCFIRPRELRQLRVGDVLIEENQIRVPGDISKNKKTQFVSIPTAFRPFVQFLKDKGSGEYIFPSLHNPDKPIGVNTMYDRHRRILDKLNFGTDYTLYSWKHTGAVAVAKAGVHITQIQKQMRHHSLEETDKYLRQMGIQDCTDLNERFPSI
jgi:integrase